MEIKWNLQTYKINCYLVITTTTEQVTTPLIQLLHLLQQLH